MVDSTAEVFPGGQMPTLHGALLPKRAGQDAEAATGPGDAQDHLRHGIARNGEGQGGIRSQRARDDEVQGSCEGGSRKLRRDADVLRDAPRVLAAHPHEQRDRAAQQGDKARSRVVGTFPDGKSALMLIAARLKYVANSEWGSHRYLDASLLKK